MRSTPAGARVVVDGREYGRTPVAVRELAEGPHRVHVVRDGYAPVDRRVTITAERSAQSITVPLERAAAAPTRTTGSTPPTYSLAGRPVSVCVAGRARAVAASAINEGDEVNVADSSGRVKTVSESAGTLVYVLGRAQTKASNANDIVIVEVAPYYKKT